MATRGSHDSPSKRMRLGTKSCAECRRRRVRCIYPLGHSVCSACALHDQPCVAQQPRSKPMSSEADESVQAMKQRLQELEHLVQQLSATSSQQGQPKDSVGASPDQLNLPVNRSSARSLANASSTLSSELETLRSRSSVADSTSSASQQGALGNAPLVHLLRNAQLISIDAPLDVEDTLKPFMADSRVKSICEAALALTPSLEHVDILLQWTTQFWPTWPPCQHCAEPAGLLGPGMISEAKDMILRGLSSTSPGFAAKALSWLALCVQQASRNIVSKIQLAMPQADLVNMYLNLIQSLLEIDDSAGGSVDSVACMNICYKLYINMGRPQKAWYWTRRAVLTAVSLGLHQHRGTPEVYESMLWATSWISERVIAHILGLPSSVSGLHSGISLADVGTSDDEQIMWHIATAVGKIIDRDQASSSSKSQYATTVQISQELEEVKDLIPADWWRAPTSAQQVPIAELFCRQRAKTLYFIHLKLLHLPYMMRSVDEPKYRHSWDLAMEASRGGVEAYAVFRDAEHGDADLCQLMDFQAFSSAMVLAVGHMICPDRATAEAKDHDWRRIDAVVRCLRRTLLTLECPVASQALRTLEVITAARRGDYVSQDEHTVVIPYFGKVSISPHLASTGSTSSNATAAALQTMPNVIEFSTNEFTNGASWRMDTELELEADWADLSALDSDVDWEQVFVSSQR